MAAVNPLENEVGEEAVLGVLRRRLSSLRVKGEIELKVREGCSGCGLFTSVRTSTGCHEAAGAGQGHGQ